MSGREQTVPMHPEVVPEDPQTVRWVLPPGVVPFAGPVREAPGALGQLLAAGVIRTIACESCAVLIQLGEAERWSEHLTHVREALSSAITDPSWQSYDDEQLGGDALLAAAVQEVLAGEAGDYVRSHGGKVTIASVTDRRVAVTFDGTCAHCPATGITLNDRLETEVRRRYPALQEITATNGNQPSALRFLSIRRRRD